MTNLRTHRLQAVRDAQHALARGELEVAATHLDALEELCVMEANGLEQYDASGAPHDYHEPGILNGIRAGCPRCRGMTPNSMSADNLVAIIGLPPPILEHTSRGLFRPGVRQVLGLVPALAFIVEGGRYEAVMQGRDELHVH